MFRHIGKTRSYSHNLKLASLLSGVAGVVNITSVLKLNTLTTNVTGHFAFFAEEIVLKNYRMALVFVLYIFFFLLGAFTSSMIMEWLSRYKSNGSYVIPISLEISVLLIVSFSDSLLTERYFSILAVSALLFSMGLQNALVTRVSQSVVRTTHLTGLFTDLGIDLSRLILSGKNAGSMLITRRVILKLSIIGGFFAGGIIGGFTFQYLDLKTLLLPAGLLILTLWYDRLLFRFYKLRRKLRDHQ